MVESDKRIVHEAIKITIDSYEKRSDETVKRIERLVYQARELEIWKLDNLTEEEYFAASPRMLEFVEKSKSTLSEHSTSRLAGALSTTQMNDANTGKIANGAHRLFCCLWRVTVRKLVLRNANRSRRNTGTNIPAVHRARTGNDPILLLVNSMRLCSAELPFFILGLTSVQNCFQLPCLSIPTSGLQSRFKAC